MPHRPRNLLLLLVALVATALVGCGGGGSADQSTDVHQLLKDTFSGNKKVDSGKLDLTLRLEAQGGSASQLNGPVTVRLSGPFQSQGKGELPLFDFAASFEGAGKTFKAGLTSTGDKAFVGFQGQEYAVSNQVFQQFKAGYEQAQKQGSSQGRQSLATLGIDPQRWLKDPKNEGDAKVGDTDVIKITGGVDVPKLLDDVNRALENARSLGVQGSATLPEKLTDEQKRQAADAIKNLAVQIYTGKDDKTLRRMVINLDVKPPQNSSSSGIESGSLALDFSLLDLNEKQDIKAPSNAKPFEQLLSGLGQLGLGGAGSSGSGSSGSGSSGSSGSSGGGASAEQLKKYSDCIEAAGNNTAKAQKCADLLSP
jgi:hypothetical protein